MDSGPHKAGIGQHISVGLNVSYTGAFKWDLGVVSCPDNATSEQTADLTAAAWKRRSCATLQQHEVPPVQGLLGRWGHMALPSSWQPDDPGGP